jgi:NAD(P)-dependent dehydrogenase (short-subunit alcohol dehydrogenase family)
MDTFETFILGASSSIAGIIVPLLDISKDEIHYIDGNRAGRVKPNWISSSQYETCALGLNNSMNPELERIFSSAKSQKIFVLNFIGSFGDVTDYNRLESGNICKVIFDNLSPFIDIVNSINSSGKTGLVISFSGAGIGGNNIEESSIGYLAAKAAHAFMLEAIDSKMGAKEIYFGSISPGPFSSKMQAIVAGASNELVSEEKIRAAKNVRASQEKTLKLVRLIDWLIEEPERAAGRIWSAQHDPLQWPPTNENFGKLRRVY